MDVRVFRHFSMANELEGMDDSFRSLDPRIFRHYDSIVDVAMRPLLTRDVELYIWIVRGKAFDGNPFDFTTMEVLRAWNPKPCACRLVLVSGLYSNEEVDGDSRAIPMPRLLLHRR